jgi:drug/metabolite transporter (DMT)-like permease
MQRHLPPNVLRGVALVLTATLLFAGMDTVGKHLMTKFNVPLVGTVRYVLNLIFLVLLVAPSQGAKLWHTQRTTLVYVRGLSLVASTFFAGLALQRMPLGETVAIFYLQGFGVMLAAGYALGERVGKVGWAAAAIGFLGVIFIARPGSALAPLGVVFALICATLSVVYVLLSRKLAATESTMAMLFHTGIAGTLVFGVMLLLQWQSFTYSRSDVVMLAFMGAASLGGHFLFTAAYRFAPASALAPFNYFHIAFATLLGWLVYKHVPDAFALLGIAMIAFSGAGIALYTHRTKAKGV